MNEKIVIKKDDKEIECEILFTFDCEDNDKSYVGYTDNSFNKDGKKNIYVSSFDPVIGLGVLEDIKDQQELDLVYDVLKQIENS